MCTAPLVVFSQLKELIGSASSRPPPKLFRASSQLKHLILTTVDSTVVKTQFAVILIIWVSTDRLAE